MCLQDRYHGLFLLKNIVEGLGVKPFSLYFKAFSCRSCNSYFPTIPRRNEYHRDKKYPKHTAELSPGRAGRKNQESV
jgi:hypothetical protein